MAPGGNLNRFRKTTSQSVGHDAWLKGETTNDISSMRRRHLQLVRRDLSICLLEIDIRNRKQGSEEIFWGEGRVVVCSREWWWWWRKVISAVVNLT
ncbi:hypothetical protein CDAR_578431 [Caerostris darwini]|uniref:Uncharacterized protein n=1 Tax=Caerostris darwini TaxID=1538125 RepID=A0AAV4WBL9_9ARAC|nr:hypothetical protein CDAR_578431 [Caerostris darwini]